MLCGERGNSGPLRKTELTSCKGGGHDIVLKTDVSVFYVFQGAVPGESNISLSALSFDEGLS